MKKNAFTLVEILAIIVVLGIIALIAVPILLGVIDNGRKKVFETDSKSIEREVLRYVSQNGISGTFIINGSTVTLNGQPTDIQSGSGYQGKIIVDADGNSKFAIHNDRWCLKKDMQSNSEIISFDENTCVINE